VFELRDAESLKIDAAVSADGANLGLIAEMERAGPYGSGHSTPILVLPRHRIADARQVGNGGHLRVDLQSETGKRLAASHSALPTIRWENS
jgi:single-stranded-DNA-specific exonuclease